jgi:hypothetical protein
LAPIVDTVNTRRAGHVEIEEHAAFASARRNSSFAAGQPRYVTFTGFP